MPLDVLTIALLLLFIIAFGSFIYGCLVRGCVTGNGQQDSGVKPDSHHPER